MFTREDHIIAGVPEQYRFVKDKLYHIRKNDDGNVVSFKPVMVYYSSDPFSYKKCIHLSPKCCYAQIEIPFDNLDKDKVRLCEMCYYKSEHKFLCDFFITSPPHWYTEYMRLYELRKRYDPEYTRILIELLDTPNS